MSDTRPKEGEPEEIIWLRGYKAGVIDMRERIRELEAENKRIREIIFDCGDEYQDAENFKFAILSARRELGAVIDD